ncbi:MAG TPA: glycosyl hydrolase, partial [Verrucomicrobiae bacterium]|nr:glycosyl hydrolase [Verrucomicrobiae bacterium]
MMRRFSFAALLGCFCLVSFVARAANQPAGTVIGDFQNPPAAARPWVYWYWMNAAVSREGITADLEAMKHAGLEGAYLMPIKDVTDPPLFTPPVRQLSPEYWAMMRHAFVEADRLGLKFAIHDCDGFATAGGPWITPDLAMQRVVWSETQITGGEKITTNLTLPPIKENFYRDIAVLAFPTSRGEGVSTRTIKPTVTTSLAGVDAQGLVDGSKRFRSDDPCWIQYEFNKPFTCRSINIQPDGNNYQALRLIVEYSDDGTNFHSLGRLETPRHGWEDTDANYTFAIPPTTATYFRFLFDPSGSEIGAEDLDSAKWKAVLKIQSLELSSAPRVPDYEGKSGVVWRKSSRATAEQIPDLDCVPLDKIINLTRHLGTNGQLTWTAPPGDWTILRLGYTPTGHHNDTAGGGKGLECDKFNPAAARIQFEGWFGETIRQVGPQLASRVLKIFHVDSWEAGSQNWSPVFQREFRRRRGYDPTPYLPLFAGIPVGSAEISERFLFDVRQTIADLVKDNFFGTMASLAHKHGCEFSAESVAPTMMSDGMLHQSKTDVPMGEFWYHSPTHDKPNDVADAISAAHVYGKNIVQSEAFTELRLQWDEHPAMLKALGDHNFCLGINRFVLHVFMHNPWLDRVPGMTLGGVGNFFQRDQTWWNFAGAWINYLSRCEATLQQGHPIADVL